MQSETITDKTKRGKTSWIKSLLFRYSKQLSFDGIFFGLMMYTEMLYYQQKKGFQFIITVWKWNIILQEKHNSTFSTLLFLSLFDILLQYFSLFKSNVLTK